MDIFPADAAAVALAPAIAGDAMSDTVEAAELLDVDVDEVTGMLAFIAPHGLCRLQRTEAIEPEALEHTADGSWRDAHLGSNLLAGHAPAAQRLDLLHGHTGRRPTEPVRPRGTVLEALGTLGLEAGNPLADGARADASGSCGGLRRLPIQNQAHDSLSTARCKTGILVDVH